MRIHVNGVSLFFDTEGSKLEQHGAELRERPTVLAIHGGPGIDHAMYRPFLSGLARTAQVIYLDLRGNGRSDQGPPERWNLASWADDVRAFCDALELQKPVVLGTSFGGFVAQAYATRYPEHPGKLILCSTNPRFHLERSLAMFERLGGPEASAVARRFFADPTPEAFGSYLQVCYPLYRRLPVGQTGAASLIQFPVARHFIGGEWHTFDFTRELKKVRCPTLVLAGAHDPVLPFAGSEDLVASLPKELVRFEPFADCSHELLAERPERAVDVMAAFLQGA
jgi:proline iminopeptidase